VKVTDLMPASSASWRSMISTGETLALSPARVHAQEHCRPVLRLGAAGPGVNGYDRVARVVFPGEQRLGFQLLRQSAQPVDFLLQVVDDGFAFARQVEVSRNILSAAAQLGVHGQRSFQAFALSQELLRAFLVRPHAGISEFGFEFG
jgi:hypothetical protein